MQTQSRGDEVFTEHLKKPVHGSATASRQKSRRKRRQFLAVCADSVGESGAACFLFVDRKDHFVHQRFDRNVKFPDVFPDIRAQAVLVV